MTTQAMKADAFAALHEREGGFIIPNPWDVGSAGLLAHAGFEALATTSAGYAFSVGRRDGTIDRDEMLAHAAAIVDATRFAGQRRSRARVWRRARDRRRNDPPRRSRPGSSAVRSRICLHAPEASRTPSEHAADRVRAAAEAARALPFRFMLTARAENYLAGRPDLADTIARLQAYQEAGADVLYAPGLTSTEEIATLVRAVDRPVNVVMGLQGPNLSLAELAAIGVKRVSVGSALARGGLRGASQGRSRDARTRYVRLRRRGGQLSGHHRDVPDDELSSPMW